MLCLYIYIIINTNHLYSRIDNLLALVLSGFRYPVQVRVSAQGLKSNLCSIVWVSENAKLLRTLENAQKRCRSPPWSPLDPLLTPFLIVFLWFYNVFQNRAGRQFGGPKMPTDN